MGALWDFGALAALVIPGAVRVLWDLSWLSALKRHAMTGSPQESADDMTDRGVTLILCAHNDLAALRTVWPDWRGQVFPAGWQVEWLVVNDGSTDGTAEWLDRQAEGDHALTVVHHLKQAPGKKGALAAGIVSARYDRLVLTDADCRPAAGWAHGLAVQLRSAKAPAGVDVVLGVCLPGPGPALLDFDARRVALQYAGEAACGRPYMGVGRSLAYRRTTWAEVGGFAPHAALAGGDDDLFVQSCIARGFTAGLTKAMAPDQAITTLPAPDWREGWARKRRHLSTATRYALPARIRLAADALLDPLIACCACAGGLLLLHSGGWIPTFALVVTVAVRTITLSSFSRVWGSNARHSAAAGIFLGPVRWALLASATLRNLFTSSPTWTQRAPTSRS